MPRKRKQPTTITQERPMEGYEVYCAGCGENYSVSLYPAYCAVCGEELKADAKKA